MEPAGDGHRVVPRLPGFGSAGRRGQPMLPTRTLMVAIPEGSTPELRILSATSEPLGALEIAPSPGVRVAERLDRPRGVGGKHRGLGHEGSEEGLQDYEDDFTADAEVYARDEEVPAAAVRLGDTGYLREQRYVEVIYSPVLYNAARGRARLVRDVEAEVVFTMSEGSAPAGSVLFEPDPQFEDIYRDSLANYEQGKLFRVHSGEASADSLQASAAIMEATTAVGGVRVKVAVSRPGIYRLDYADLQASAPELLAVNPQLLTLSAEGVEVPISIRDPLGNSGELDGQFGTADFLEFYGQPKREAPTTPSSNLPPGSPEIFQANDFTDTQIYWLEALDPAGSHRRIPSVTLPVSPAFPVAPHFAGVAVWDENNLYLPLEDNDPFFSIPSLLAGSAQATRDVSVPLPGLAPVSATDNVAIRLRGGSDLTVSLDHRTKVWVNNDTAGGAETFWDGEIIQPVAFSEAQAVLTNPTTVHFSLPGQAGVTLDKQYIDTVTISYRRLFSAAGDALLFSYPNQDTRFQVSGFSGPAATIYEVTRTLAGSLEADPVRLTGASAQGLPVTLTFDVSRDPFPSAPATRWFFVAGPQGVLHPDGMTRAADPTLHDPANSADIIVIGTPATIDPAVGGALDNLLAYRSSSQGLTSKVVFVDRIYDEFSYGLRDPNAIR
ncbi:MAG TPA: C25 family peptidase propeptide domain-containing protein, partial [Candidatus Binatia bacterium]|nr:C25 family peptidase propeptide domain-containing protein [Candidatus Binatia bacterium]